MAAGAVLSEPGNQLLQLSPYSSVEEKITSHRDLPCLVADLIQQPLLCLVNTIQSRVRRARKATRSSRRPGTQALPYHDLRVGPACIIPPFHLDQPRRLQLEALLEAADGRRCHSDPIIIAAGAEAISQIQYKPIKRQVFDDWIKFALPGNDTLLGGRQVMIRSTGIDISPRIIGKVIPFFKPSRFRRPSIFYGEVPRAKAKLNRL